MKKKVLKSIYTSLWKYTVFIVLDFKYYIAPSVLTDLFEVHNLSFTLQVLQVLLRCTLPNAAFIDHHIAKFPCPFAIKLRMPT